MSWTSGRLVHTLYDWCSHFAQEAYSQPRKPVTSLQVRACSMIIVLV
jgi:hypothetical protein